MDETQTNLAQQPILNHEGHEPVDGVDYMSGIEYALDGYAPDADSWNAAHTAFITDLHEHGSVDAAARVALASIGEDAEISYEEAETKFWDYVEGENGPHSRYGRCINDALDGYAPDGASWLEARDAFFENMRRGLPIDEALEQALGTISEGAESTSDEAVGRFLEKLHLVEQQESQRNEALESRNGQLASYTPRVTEVRPGSRVGLEAVAASREIEDTSIAWFKEKKMQAIELAPPSRERELGVNMERVNNFLKSKDLQPAPALLLSSDDVKGYADKLIKLGYPSSYFEPLVTDKPTDTLEVGGVYMALVGVVIVIAEGAERRGLTDHGRAIFLEQVLAHEQAHASETQSEKDILYEAGKGHWINRGGSGVQRLTRSKKESYLVDASAEGDFFEEGFAQLLAGEYVRNELNLPNGIWGNQPHPGFHPGSIANMIGGEHVWPGTEPGTYNIATAAFPAIGLQLLINQSPDLYEALIDARSSVGGLRKIAKIVNAAEPGLYTRLRKLRYNQKDFMSGLTAIQHAVEKEAP